MTSWSFLFLVVSIVCAICGFTDTFGATSVIFEILFYMFLILTFVCLVSSALNAKRYIGKKQDKLSEQERFSPSIAVPADIREPKRVDTTTLPKQELPDSIVIGGFEYKRDRWS